MVEGQTELDIMLADVMLEVLLRLDSLLQSNTNDLHQFHTSSVTQTLHVLGTIPRVVSRTQPLVVFNHPKELCSS